MRKSILSIIAIFALTILSYGQSKVELSGTVIDKETDETVVGAKVVCDNILIIKTDIDGKYFFQVDADKTHELKITCVGFDTLVISVKEGNQSTLLDVVLPKL